MKSKTDLRRHFKQIREQLDAQAMSEWSRRMAREFNAILRQRGFDGSLFLFAPLRGEPDLLADARQYHCQVALPIITGHGSMQFHHWVPGDRLELSALGILTPHESAPIMIPRPGDAMVVPALAIDAGGVRLGFGGGYYDRYLRAHRDLFSFVAGAVFPPLFSAEALPSEPHDQGVDFCLKIPQSV
jgi:5-formyltetrahydrofolate cyclo-ligase